MPSRHTAPYRPEFNRSWSVEDIAIRSDSGDRRTVDAYAAVFDVPVEVNDANGHYIEVIDRSAFDRTLSMGNPPPMVLYNHGLSVYGTPEMMGSVPIGRSLDVRPDGRGLRTSWRMNSTALGDAVLESITNGDIAGMSFRGRIFNSDPRNAPPRRRRESQPPPTVRRLELGLTDYGPTPQPVYADATILAVRALAHVQLTEAQRADMERLLGFASPTLVEGSGESSEDGDPDVTPVDDSAMAGRRMAIRRARLRAEMTRRGLR